jgi:hypothetical protein
MPSIFERRLHAVALKLQALPGAGHPNTLSRGELQEVEELLGVTLPEDLRAFVQHVADGAPGPLGGLLSLGRAVELAEELSDRPCGIFPLKGPLQQAIAMARAEREILSLGGEGDLDAIYLKHELHCLKEAGVEACLIDGCLLDGLGMPTTHPALVAGTLPLAHTTGHTIRIILQGPQRGSVWDDLRQCDGGIHPSFAMPRLQNTPFLDWYEGWLDAALLAPTHPLAFARQGSHPRA